MDEIANITVSVKVPLTIADIAEAFCALSDDGQAKVFVAIAERAKRWKDEGSMFGAWYQWTQIGQHLRDCECSTEDAREMIRAIASSMEFEG
jgi:hypothetical protein